MDLFYKDLLGRPVPKECTQRALRLLDDFKEYGIPPPIPMESCNEDDKVCIYLQWKNASMYVYEDEYVFLTPSNGRVTTGKATISLLDYVACVGVVSY